MKQLLIVTANQDLTNGLSTFADASKLNDGAIGLIKQNTPTAWQDSTIPTASQHNDPDVRGDFWICHKTANQPLKVIEVDKESLQVTRQFPMAGATWSAKVAIPTVTDGSTYTIVLVKKGTVPNERNTWTATETVFVGDTTTDKVKVAKKLAEYFQHMNEFGGLPVSVSVGATPGTNDHIITFTANNVGDQWTLAFADDLNGVTPTDVVLPVKAVGDAAHIKKLASECAANFGFTDTYRDGDTIYPGYPVEVPAGNYVIYTLRFATNRKASKTRDERASQLVHIAVSIGNNIYTPSAEEDTPEERLAAAKTYYEGLSMGTTIKRLDEWFNKAFVSTKGIISEGVTDGIANTVKGYAS